MNKWDYLLEERLPHFWCPGCGNGIILKTLATVFAELGLKKEKIVVVTGIGCWGKADDYLSTNSLHGTHGRALAYATGVKAANPQLTVVVLMGDGDGATIGGNHLIHAARKNIELTTIVSNNFIYGMTGGQYSATTPWGERSSTSPYGNAEKSFDLCALVEAAGASYVARSTVYHVQQMKNLIKEALEEPSFSFIDVFSSCPTYSGRFMGREKPAQLLEFFKERACSMKKFNGLSEEEKKDHFLIGRFIQRDEEGFLAKYRKIQEQAKQAAKGEGA